MLPSVPKTVAVMARVVLAMLVVMPNAMMQVVVVGMLGIVMS